MGVIKLQIDDFQAANYQIIAVHSSLEDYRLAYCINQQLGVSLEKSLHDIEIQIPEGFSHFTRFVFDDQPNERYWNLITNKTSIVNKLPTTSSLFEQTTLDITSIIFLLPELKKVDYLLKIEHSDTIFNATTLIDHLLAVKHIATAYTINPAQIKSKNNLIF